MPADCPFPLQKCLAKTRMAGGQPAPGRNVEEHCRIAGAVCQELLKRMFAFWQAGPEIFPKNAQLAPLLHDVGKVCPTFQVRLYQSLGPLPPELAVYPKIDEKAWGGHPAVSFAALAQAGGGKYLPLCAGMHHAREFSKKKADCDLYGGSAWENLRQELIANLRADRQFPQISSFDAEELLSGLTILCDWIASGELFQDPATPWQPLIATSLDKAGLIWPEVKKGLSFEDIFGFAPTETQKAFAAMATGPGVYVLEAPMGAGKTEAALHVAYNLLASGQASGLYFGLPTQLTSNRMQDRVSDFLAKILLSPARVVLAHADAWLKRYLEQDMGNEAEVGGSWFEQGRKAILAPFAVGTVDQALMAVIRVRWSALRTMGLAGKVVILDEAHSYDPYTGFLLQELVRRLGALGCTVIILSATLTSEKRAALLNAGRQEKSEISEQAYPLACGAPFGAPCVQVKTAVQSRACADIQLVHDDDAAFDEIIGRAADGQQCLWIENTVNMAQQVFRKLSARGVALGIELGLVHSRFTVHDRNINEGYWTSLLGKPQAATAGLRSQKGRILVGTQVLEQSLDIDADFLVSRFAPTDLVLQRLGRLWRHQRPDRPACARREAWLLAPPLEKALQNPATAFAASGSSHVYAPYVLARSLEVWAPRNNILLPEDIRPLLMATHCQRSQEPCEAMQKVRKELDLQVRRLIGNARQNITALGNLMPDTDACTRLNETEQVKILLLRGFDANAATCLLPDGKIDLGASGRDRRAVAARLALHIVKTPIFSAPDVRAAPPHQWLQPFFHEAGAHGNATLRVLLVASSHRASNIYGAPLENISYNSRVGYVFEKPGTEA